MSISRSESDAAPVALISGGSAGLGLVIANQFARAGYRIVITGRNPERLAVAAETLQQHTPVTIQADMTDSESCDRVASTIKDRCGRLDVLVNCIGKSDRGLTEHLQSDHLKDLFDANVISTLCCTQAMLPMLEASRGSVVNIGSLAGKVGARHLGGYVAAKHALSGLTQQMRLELKERGVHVALVSPGPIRREDAGERYSERVDESLPERASRPGGGTKVKGLDPNTVASAVLRCAQKKKVDVVLPGYLRWLITAGNAFPRLGDWLLLRFTS